MKEITLRLKRHCEGHPRLRDLHPFERCLLDLSVGEASYFRIIGNIDNVRKRVNQVSGCASR